MSYKALIDSSLNKAFNLIKDLAVPVTFVKKTGTAFDFSSAEATVTTVTNISIKIVIVETKKTSKDSDSKSQQIMMKKKDVGDITLFDSVIINGVTWRLGDVITDSGYVILTNVFKD